MMRNFDTNRKRHPEEWRYDDPERQEDFEDAAAKHYVDMTKEQLDKLKEDIVYRHFNDLRTVPRRSKAASSSTSKSVKLVSQSASSHE